MYRGCNIRAMRVAIVKRMLIVFWKRLLIVYVCEIKSLICNERHRVGIAVTDAKNVKKLKSKKKG